MGCRAVHVTHRSVVIVSDCYPVKHPRTAEEFRGMTFAEKLAAHELNHGLTIGMKPDQIFKMREIDSDERYYWIGNQHFFACGHSMFEPLVKLPKLDVDA